MRNILLALLEWLLLGAALCCGAVAVLLLVVYFWGMA